MAGILIDASRGEERIAFTIPTDSPMRLRFLVDALPAWFVAELQARVGKSDTDGRIFTRAVIARWHSRGWIVEICFRDGQGEDSPQLRELLTPLLGLPKIDLKAKDKNIAQQLARELSGILIREKKDRA